MSESINFCKLEDIVPIIKIKIAEDEIAIRVFFSISCYEYMLKSYEKDDDYRVTFARIVFHMYQKLGKINKKITEDDFINLPDEILYNIIDEILKQDNKFKEEYDNIDVENPYEKFYKAYEYIFKNIAIDLTKVFEKTSSLIASLNEPLINSLSTALDNFRVPKIEKNEIFQMSNFHQLETALKNMPEMPFPKLVSVISNVPTPNFGIHNIFSPLSDMREVIGESRKNMFDTLHNMFLDIEESIHTLMTSIYFSLLTYRKEWNKEREVLLDYDWFYLSELPEEIVNYVYENRKTLNKDDVDKIVIKYFRENRCEKLKNIVYGWNNLSYFICRKRIFHEALVNHSRKYFNSSITLLAVHTEGVITDFVRTVLQNPRYRINRAIEDVKEELKNNEDISMFEYEIYNDVIEKIEQAFNEGFDCANPDKTSNGSRNKIAHGHVYEKETEVNSLKHFLCLNELYHLFLLLDNHKSEILVDSCRTIVDV